MERGFFFNYFFFLFFFFCFVLSVPLVSHDEAKTWGWQWLAQAAWEKTVAALVLAHPRACRHGYCCRARLHTASSHLCVNRQHPWEQENCCACQADWAACPGSLRDYLRMTWAAELSLTVAITVINNNY